MNRAWVVIMIALGLATFDFCLKGYIQEHIPLMSALFPAYPYGGLPVFHDFCGIDFSINHVINHGAAWGAFGDYEGILLFLRIVMIVGMICYLFFFNKKAENRLPFTLILTGAIGNVIDHFRFGHVVDMFHFKFWGHSFAIFNLADATICAGVILLFLYPWWIKLRNKHGSHQLS